MTTLAKEKPLQVLLAPDQRSAELVETTTGPGRLLTASQLPAGEVVEVVCSALATEPLSTTYSRDAQVRRYFRRALEGLLSCLSMAEGSWQHRWTLFEPRSADQPLWWHGIDPVPTLAHSRSYNLALGQLVRHDLFRPSHEWMRGRLLFFIPTLVRWRDPAAAAALAARYAAMEMSPAVVTNGTYLLGSICANTGKLPRQVTGEDILHVRALRKNLKLNEGKSASSLWSAMHGLGWLGDVEPVMPTPNRRQPPRTVEQQVDDYRLECPQREVLVEYLKTRSASMDYSSSANLVRHLAGNFWADIAAHHPGLPGFALTHEQAEAWRARLVTRRDGSRRKEMLATLFAVRAFYLDLGKWALNDSYWAPWVSRCPVDRVHLKPNTKNRRKVIARQQQRTRDLSPLLPALVAEADKQKRLTLATLEAARAAGTGGVVTIDDEASTVCAERSAGLRVKRDSRFRFLASEESRAFWGWAIVETLRHSGIRIEEMLELTHLAIQPYVVKPTGETIPLVHIPPSKTDEERMVVASPELVHVLSTVLKRIRGTDQQVPLTQRWDPHERQLGQPLPHLFVHRHQSSLQVLTPGSVHRFLIDLARKARLTHAGEPVHFTPHDFRRVFATEALANGLPPHVVQVLLGHKSLATTQGYAAIYPQDVIRHHRTFIAARRLTRPSEEYREPTPKEWAEFEAHFVQRKVSLGTCGRGYGTSCQHEHACLRCGLLRPDPAQADRLGDIITNLADRISEAEHHNWLGEVEGLKISLEAARLKLAQMERQVATSTSVDLGLPRPRAGLK